MGLTGIVDELTYSASLFKIKRNVHLMFSGDRPFDHGSALKNVYIPDVRYRQILSDYAVSFYELTEQKESSFKYKNEDKGCAISVFSVGGLAYAVAYYASKNPLIATMTAIPFAGLGVYIEARTKMVTSLLSRSNQPRKYTSLIMKLDGSTISRLRNITKEENPN